MWRVPRGLIRASRARLAAAAARCVVLIMALVMAMAMVTIMMTLFRICSYLSSAGSTCKVCAHTQSLCGMFLMLVTVSARMRTPHIVCACACATEGGSERARAQQYSRHEWSPRSAQQHHMHRIYCESEVLDVVMYDVSERQDFANSSEGSGSRWLTPTIAAH